VICGLDMNKLNELGLMIKEGNQKNF